jgi:ABC-type dipeptide/oligopeptide/nickel transport system permease subunit
MSTMLNAPSAGLSRPARASGTRSALSALAATWRRLPGTAKVGAILLGMFILAGIIGPELAPYNPATTSALSSAAPSGAHLLGTTQTGQDILSQVLVGVRLTLELAFWVGVIATALSVIVGVSAAFLGGVWDEALSLLTNVFLVLPALPLLVVLLGFLNGTSAGQGQLPVILVLSGLGWPWGARVVRVQALTIRGRDFIAAARETGERSWRIIGFDIIPNMVSLIAASFVNTVLYAVGASVALAFVGLTDPNSYSLGTILYWAELGSAVENSWWWWYVPPGLLVALLGMALVLFNTGIDELSNPRLRDARSITKIARRRVWPTDPTPVLGVSHGRGGLAGFARSFSRRSLIDEGALAAAGAGSTAGTAGKAGELS